MKFHVKEFSIAIGLAVFVGSAQLAFAQDSVGPPVFAGIFGSRNLTVANPNDPGNDYTMVHHAGNNVAAHNALAYDAGRGWGFEIIDPGNTGQNNALQFGPFDESPNNRNEFADTLPDELYDSFIGFKNHPSTCDASVVGNPDDPCSPTIAASGGVFRVDVPNGLYRFVGVFGDADNRHAHRVLVQDGGSGAPALGAGSHIVLVNNHDQAQWTNGATPEGGDGVYATVGFLDKLPPAPQGEAAVPVFVNMDAGGMPAGGDGTGMLDSPALLVTQGYVRLHLLQGNSNDGPAGGRDPNGADVVLFEIHPVPEPATAGLLGFGLLGLIGMGRRRRR